MSENPLKKYSQRPGTYVKLPSGGRYYNDPPKMSADGELEVRPMTAMDEIRLKNPDGLLNSEALFQVIEHVAPGINDAREIPTPDLDLIVIAMRIATYGELMDVSSSCKKCSETEVYQMNLSGVIASAKTIDAPDSVKIDDLTVNIKPHTAESNTMLSNYQVEIARAARQFEQASIDQKQKTNDMLADIMKKGSKLLFEIAAKHIVSVTTPDGEINDKEFIREWLEELKAPDYQKIRDGVNALSKECVNRKMSYTCSKCETRNEVEVTFDPANFFGASSL